MSSEELPKENRMTDQNLDAIQAATMNNLSQSGVTSVQFADDKEPMDPADFPTDQVELEAGAEELLSDLENGINAIIILSTVDPLAVDSTGYLYTEDQRSLIIKAGELVADWRS